MSEKITGYIDHVVFRNNDNGYTVMVVKGTKEEELTCVGSFPSISQGVTIEAEGTYTTHPVYGKQFQIHSYTEKMPEDSLAMERYLGSGAIKGIGAALAARIVRHFGEDTLRIVEEEPERLSEVKGISEKKAREIAAQVTEKADMRRAMIFLQKYGISLNLGAKIYQKYGQAVYGVLQENPYRLAEDISGVGFKIADEIASRIGIHTDSDYRIRSGMLYTLMQASGEGHIYLPQKELFERASRLLDVDPSYMEKHLMDMAIDRKLVLKETKEATLVYPSKYYQIELNTARMLNELNIKCPENEKLVERRLAQIQKETGTVLDEMQKKAVKEAAENGLFILTGGPGTGKTTTINAIIRFFEGEGAELRLAAPTGRAAKRMTETTGYEAQTIHRLLELNGVPDEEHDNQAIHFDRNAQNPLDADVIIIDEMSMVDIFLMRSLLRALVPGTRLIMVGDADQLPSVGAGNVLRDILDSEVIPSVRLTEIFRQDEKSMIVYNAHRINRGESPRLNAKGSDFFFERASSPTDAAKRIVALCSTRLPGFLGLDPVKQMQVLSPTKKGECGVWMLNQLLQAEFNPPTPGKHERVRGDTTFREGDKVMQTRNNYQLKWQKEGVFGAEEGQGVFNGDIGFIVSIDPQEHVMQVQFDDERLAEYEGADVDDLELAYCISVHKSQGSEFPVVVMPAVGGPPMLLTRNLFYTAVTRARRMVMIVGRESAIDQMIANVNTRRRYSALCWRLQQVMNL